MKQLKSALMDFYIPEDISVAKVRLLDDIRSLNSTIKLPHVPQRRDEDQRLVREVDDIMLLLSRLDEHKLLDELPRYVSSSPDKMPSVRLYEGEFNGLMTMLKRMDNTISQMASKLAAIARDVKDLQARPPEQFPSLPRPAVISNVQQPQQPVSGQLTVTSDGKPDSAPVSIAADEALETRPVAVPDLAKLISTPTPCSTRPNR